MGYISNGTMMQPGSEHLSEFAVNRPNSASAGSGSHPPGSVIEPAPGIEGWLRGEVESLSGRWLSSLASQGAVARGNGEKLLESFIPFLTSFLPLSMGAFREPAEPIWKQAAELYGSVAAMRGLAAGEVIEEFQSLREVLIRRVWQAVEGEEISLGLRDLLLLNRTVDLGVTHSSIGHTDALFFALFHGAGVPRSLSPEILDEVGTQMAGLRAEMLRLERP